MIPIVRSFVRRLSLLGSLCLLLLFTPLPTQAEEPSLQLQQVLQSTRSHYPKIQEAQEKIAESTGKVQEARGAFDWYYQQSSFNRMHGYYDGRFSEHQVRRRLSSTGAEVYGGWRMSDGSFPLYEDQFRTGSEGEYHIGMMLSLWRDRVMDEERFKLADAELELQQQQAELLLTRLAMDYDATTAYLDWLAAGLTLRVAEDQLALAQERQQGFATRVSKGDLARIYLTENQQYILKREGDVVEARRQLDNAALRLSLYWRDTAGTPITPDKNALPPDVQAPSPLQLANLEQEIQRVQQLQPERIVLDLAAERQKKRLQLGENALLPQVDFLLETARDIGTGPTPRQETEAKVGVKISVPLQQNVGRGRMAQSQAAIRQLEQRKRLLNDRLATEIIAAATNYEAAQKAANLAEDAVDAASTMQQAEARRFNSGATDFFVLNLREEKTAEARIARIRAYAKWWEATARYFITTLRQDKLTP